MHYKEGQDRHQVMMFSYDSMITADNPVRLIDLMCRKFISDNPVRANWKGNTNEGCKSYPPGSMLNLLVYGYFNGIATSRKLEKETYRNIEVIWLMEGFRPDHWTICEFRRENKELIKDFVKTFRRFLQDESYITGEKVAFDGSKMKAYASRNMLSEKSIEKKLDDIDKSLLEYLEKVEKQDTLDQEMEETKKEIEVLKERVEKLEKERDKWEGYKKLLEDSGKQRISPHDTDAILVKGRDGKFAGYNAQLGVDTKHHFIVTADVTMDTNDTQQLLSCMEAVTEQLGTPPKEILADKGYSNTTQIVEVEANGQTQCYIPLPKTSREKEQEKGITFNYNEESDTYTCIEGKELILHTKEHLQAGAYYDIYKCHDCKGCSVREKCTTSKTGRTFKRNVNQKKIDEYRLKLQGKDFKAKIHKRKEIVEHPFGTIKWLMGKFNFVLTGQEKVQTEFDLYTTAYNIKRLTNLTSMPLIMEQIKGFAWKAA